MPSSKYYYTFRKTNDFYALHLSNQVALGLLKVIMILIAILIMALYQRQLYNTLFLKIKKFTEDEKLIDFAKHICPDFQNTYSINYIQNDNLLEQEEAQLELEESKYQSFVSKEVLITKASWLFDQFQQDRTNSDFESIKEYTLEPFKSKYKYIGDRSVNQKVDITYSHNLSEIIPLKFEIREELKRFVVQINGEMIRFQVSDKGYILGGQPQLRYFTEYWDIALEMNNKSYIVGIYKIK